MTNNFRMDHNENSNQLYTRELSKTKVKARFRILILDKVEISLKAINEFWLLPMKG